jgi:hypothetical protein
VIDGDRGDHGDGPVGDVGAVPGATDPDLDDGHVHRGVGERGERHPGQHLEERQPGLVPPVHDRQVRQQFLVELDEPPRAERLAVQADPLAHAGQMRAGEQPRTQAPGAQQRVDHPRRRRLAVGPGDVDDRAGPLRVAEQAGQVGDPVQGGVDGVLGSARRDVPLHLGQGSPVLRVCGVAGHPGSLPAR